MFLPLKRRSSLFLDSESEVSGRSRLKSRHPTPPNSDAGAVEEAAPGDEEEEADLAPKKMLSFHAPYGNTLAAAYFDPETRKIYVMEDTKDTWGWDLACLLMEQVRPDHIILSTKAPDSLIDKVREFCTDRPTESSLQPFKSFHPSSATSALASVQVTNLTSSVFHPPDPSSETRRAYDEMAERYGYAEEKGAGMGKMRFTLLKMGFYVNVDAPTAVSATGGLITYLKKEKIIGAGPVDQGLLELAAIESMALEQHMLINNDALTSLAILDVEAHGFYNTERQKQALSIFGILGDQMSTPLGRKLLHTWHLRPLLDIGEIEQRHNAVELFSNPNHQHIAAHMRRAMKGVGNVKVFCNAILRGRSKPRDWKGLLHALAAGVDIKDTAMGVAEGRRVPIIERIRKEMTIELNDFEKSLVTIIDWDASKDEKRVCIRIGVDAELDEWRERLASYDLLLAIMPTVPPGFASDVNVLYFPQLGCLVAVALQDDGGPAPAGWDLSFETDDLHYYKTPHMRNLDNQFGDLHSLIVDREMNLVGTLTTQLKEIEPGLLALVDAIAELDCLLALAHAAQSFQLNRPILTEEPILEIRDGRHLLQELCVSQYISNDTVIAGGSDSDRRSMMIVTGANGSGKSAYGKQVALIAFMAQIGSFVPAGCARIGICDKIYTRLQTRESVSKTASAFMIDLGQVSHALRGATSRSLVILDEFGKGTTPADGAGLLAGVIEHLITGPCPRTIVLTHFHELFAQQFLPPDIPILFCHMKTVLVEGSTDITYLYNLTSNAAECALLHGLSPAVVERGREVSELISTFQISKILDAELTEEDEAELQEAEDLARRFLSWTIDEKTTDVMDALRDMLDQGQVEEGSSEAEEREQGEDVWWDQKN